jgi:PAT family acetyl-CoA transporter-like MFS transporter 1
MVYLLLPNRALEPWSTATMPAYAVAVIFVLSNAHSAIQSLQFMAQMSFFSRVAKQSPSNSATVMTLLNALTNLGSMWPRPLILWAMEALSSKQCLARGGGEARAGAGVGACNSAEASTACKGLGGLCVSVVSGYPVVVALGTAYCAAWWWAMRARVTKLASAPASGWTLAR